MISVIIRTKNEERWISHCLERIRRQNVVDIEVVLVDNRSTDKTVERARHVYSDLKLVTIEDYRPGLAINQGIRSSQGEYIVCLSAHCLPVNDDWLEVLRANLAKQDVAGVYGRQIPTRFTHPLDKRDLLITFGLDRRIQQRDTFFHNANSMFRREVWNNYPFNEEVTNIEDRVWAKEVIDAGYKLVYEPNAPVYHYHGIHHSNQRERYENTVRIMEQLKLQPEHELDNPFDPIQLDIAAVIPIRDSKETGVDSDEKLIHATLQATHDSQYINRIIISTDSEDVAKRAAGWGAEAPFIRPPELSADGVRVDQVLEYTVNELERQGYYLDLVVPLEITYPFRPPGLLDQLIDQHLEQGQDTTIAGFSEYRSCWVNRGELLVRIDEHDAARHLRDPLHIGLISLGCVTYPQIIRTGTRLGDNLGIYEIHDPLAAIEIRQRADLPLFERLQTLIEERSGITEVESG